MNKEKELTLVEEQISVERGDFQLNPSSSTTALRTSYLDINNEGSDATDGADADGTDGTDTDVADVADTDGTDVSDTDGGDSRM